MARASGRSAALTHPAVFVFVSPWCGLAGVFTITSPAELAAFMAEESRYDKYIVQSLVVRKRLAHAAHAHMF